jgi:hypothetical protein
MRLSRPIAMQALGGAIAGLIVTLAFFASPLISPVVFYGWYALAGALYGAAAGLAVRSLLPDFSMNDVAKMSGILATGFFAIIFIAITLNQNNIVSVAYTAFVLPPIVAMICGALARRLIVQAGEFAHDDGRPGFFWGALVFSPGFWFFGIIVGLTITRFSPNMPANDVANWYSVFVGSLAGALGGWLSGSLLVRRIRTAFEEETKPEAQDILEWQTAGETLTVVDAPKEKPKGVPKTQPTPALNLPVRAIAATGVVTFVAAWLIFSTLPSLPQLGIVQPPFVPPPLFHRRQPTMERCRPRSRSPHRATPSTKRCKSSISIHLYKTDAIGGLTVTIGQAAHGSTKCARTMTLPSTVQKRSLRRLASRLRSPVQGYTAATAGTGRCRWR